MMDASGIFVCHSDLDLTLSHWWWLALAWRGALQDFEMNSH